MKPAGILFWLGMLLLARGALAQDALVRTSLAKDHVWVGERLTWVVELYAPGYFDSAPSFDYPDPQGLQLLPPSQRPILRRESVKGTDYTVQRYELAVFARHGGAQVIPPLTVKFLFKRSPLDKTVASAELKTEPVSFTAQMPPGAENIGSLVSARDLKLTETWQPEPGKKIRVGDAFTRTITFTAPDMPGMAFPQFPAGKIPGLSIYPKPPEVLDENYRSGDIGRSRTVITYVCQEAGRFTIPAARLTWFDLESKQLQAVDLPARVLIVAENPALAPSTPVAVAESAAGKSGFVWPDKHQIIIGLSIAMGFVILGSLLWRTRWIWPWMGGKFRPVRLEPLNPGGEK